MITVESADGGESHPLTVEIARTAQQRQVGLMFREELGEDAGMLFLFDRLSASGFWMNNTLIPLDIAYLAADGTIQEIREGVPLDRTPLRPEEPYLYVVETNVGWFEGNGFGVGDRVVIPQEVLDGPTAANRFVVPALARNPLDRPAVGPARFSSHNGNVFELRIRPDRNPWKPPDLHAAFAYRQR